ncbi:hypothetical protein B0181_10645 [Moraxella caviae]|uniref:Uncharacterized protein n=1 Tax=Moraxella caviae TaxID=34060 RepID=A0A1S9ZUQ9_9GAMM|nr:hypothetical protein [Moraxella caviae]OOR87246.1 hypothetical protein B0181_10645 [Moraxella caviae]STZ14820.1 Uncharacterised protein [Moraxella caviae]VEW11287.1 Uncharacterised protein [Moraxella caviae]
MTRPNTLDELAQQIAQLQNDIARLKRHNFTLITLIGNLIDGEKLKSPSIMEISVIYDLMGDELQSIRAMIADYQDLASFTEQANQLPNPNISADSIMFVVQAFLNNGTLSEQCAKILSDYDNAKQSK